MDGLVTYILVGVLCAAVLGAGVWSFIHERNGEAPEEEHAKEQ
ncbi:hypothetical protein [Cuneatibacter caecimuris]|uniref:Uncharacterized protein n=1 Tax=Cuneatibacter caecimuris TaxID=1796618 RepID=A0A4Q7PJS8_9FIRM|nr:hypothetical protein [Cuneatibacter caecimuris]RZT00528.1 hypothetical protein EV209_1849 [Cuneatibacter caecimuris]